MKDIKKIVRIYKKKLQESGIPVSDLYIFGSYAKGTANKWSDIDVCVISSRFGKNRHTERIWLMNLRDSLTEDIEPHPYSAKDFKIPYDSLATEIKKTGVRIE